MTTSGSPLRATQHCECGGAIALVGFLAHDGLLLADMAMSARKKSADVTLKLCWHVCRLPTLYDRIGFGDMWCILVATSL